MVRDGLMGTPAGDGLKQIMQRQSTAGFKDAQMWYRVAREYNSGHVDPSGDLALGGATAAYASDVANRLVGWHHGDSEY